jgi:hypothetical protein
MQEKLSEIEDQIEDEKRKTHLARCVARRSLANLCEVLGIYELSVETESEQKEQEAAVAVNPALS